jgi:hypothetical protein
VGYKKLIRICKKLIKNEGAKKRPKKAFNYRKRQERKKFRGREKKQVIDVKNKIKSIYKNK